MNIDNKEQLKKGIPEFKAGDTLRVSVKVVEGDTERIQNFDGVVMARRGSGISESFTVRKISFGVGVERIFPLHSPRIEKIQVLKVGKVRRAKLNYLRKLSGKAARLQEKAKLTPGSQTTKEEVTAENVAPAPVAATATPEAAATEAK